MKNIEVNDLKLLEILNRIPFFKRFSPGERASFLASAVHFLKCPAGRHIIRKGEHETSFYIILAGEASVFVKKELHPVGVLKPGYFIGEGAFINNNPRSASVIANTPMVLIRLDQESLLRFPSSIREKIKDQIIEGMANRISDMNSKYLNVDSRKSLQV